LKFLLGKKPILRVGKHDRSRTLLVVVRNMINPSAHGVAPHLAGVIGLQQIRDRMRVTHPWIEPQVVAIWMKDDWHPVVDC